MFRFEFCNYCVLRARIFVSNEVPAAIETETDDSPADVPMAAVVSDETTTPATLCSVIDDGKEERLRSDVGVDDVTGDSSASVRKPEEIIGSARVTNIDGDGDIDSVSFFALPFKIWKDLQISLRIIL